MKPGPALESWVLQDVEAKASNAAPGQNDASGAQRDIPSRENQRIIDQALADKFGDGSSTKRGRLTMLEVGADHVVAAGEDGKRYRVGFTMNKNGGVDFGQPEEIESNSPSQRSTTTSEGEEAKHGR